MTKNELKADLQLRAPYARLDIFELKEGETLGPPGWYVQPIAEDGTPDIDGTIGPFASRPLVCYPRTDGAGAWWRARAPYIAGVIAGVLVLAIIWWLV